MLDVLDFITELLCVSCGTSFFLVVILFGATGIVLLLEEEFPNKIPSNLSDRLMMISGILFITCITTFFMTLMLGAIVETFGG